MLLKSNLFDLHHFLQPKQPSRTWLAAFKSIYTKLFKWYCSIWRLIKSYSSSISISKNDITLLPGGDVATSIVSKLPTSLQPRSKRFADSLWESAATESPQRKASRGSTRWNRHDQRPGQGEPPSRGGILTSTWPADTVGRNPAITTWDVKIFVNVRFININWWISCPSIVGSQLKIPGLKAIPWNFTAL